MEKERNLGVTEARFALTILTCLLVAIGYIALLKLGGKDPSTDVGPEEAPSVDVAGTPTPPAKLPPRVLSLEKLEDARTATQQTPDSERR